MGTVLVVDGGVVTGPAGPQGPRGDSVVVSSADGGCAFGGVKVSLEDGGTPQLVCNGAPGAQGLVGATGAQGPAGPVGATGAQGPAGAVGATGAQGPAGPVGATGAQGPAGPVGATGAQGPAGPVGATGPAGPAGPALFLDGGVASTGYPGDPADGVVVVGFTALKFSGNLGGLLGGNQRCDAEFPGAHLCLDREYAVAGSSIAIPTGGAWIDVGDSTLPLVRDRDWTASDCSQWTDATTGNYGQLLNTSGQALASNTCQTARSLACCRAPTRYFRGFTSSSFTGNLGGVAGANQKCNAAFPGAHFCLDREYFSSGSALTVPASGAWVDLGDTSKASVRDRYRTGSDCAAWTDATTGNFGRVITTVGGFATPNTCQLTRPLACCGGG